MLRRTLTLALLAVPLWAAPRHTLLAIWSHPDDETVIGAAAPPGQRGRDIFE